MIFFNKPEMFDLIKAFHTITGIRIAFFDIEYNEIVSYPSYICDYCSIIKKCPATEKMCRECDINALKKCKEMDSVLIYKCFSGITEAAIAIRENDVVLGYLVFGQVSDQENNTFLYASLPDFVNKFDLDANELAESIPSVKHKSMDEIIASAKLLSACVSYVIYKELISHANNRTFEIAKTYIEENLNKDLSIYELCKVCNIGRTKLYECIKEKTGMGIAKYTLSIRMAKAKHLLKTTNLAISEVASQVGFSDYNYFTSVFKKNFGVSPKNYKKQYS